MYSPSYYQVTDKKAILSLIKEYGFATLLTDGSSNSISHLPFIAEESANGEIDLLSHMAASNPHWKELEKVGRGKTIFQGPHAYISPAWYQPKPDNVPTWNYAVVHAIGRFEIVRDTDEAIRIMNDLVNQSEALNRTGWSLNSSEPSVQSLMKHIVVFKLKNVKFEAKFKLSQKQNSVDRENVIKQLKERGESSLAQYMESAKADTQEAEETNQA